MCLTKNMKDKNINIDDFILEFDTINTIDILDGTAHSQRTTTKRYYTGARGHKIGVFTTWYGPQGAEAQVKKFSGGQYKKFKAREGTIHYIFKNK